jgi:hypothetical protein
MEQIQEEEEEEEIEEYASLRINGRRSKKRGDDNFGDHSYISSKEFGAAPLNSRLHPMDPHRNKWKAEGEEEEEEEEANSKTSRSQTKIPLKGLSLEDQEALIVEDLLWVFMARYFDLSLAD